MENEIFESRIPIAELQTVVGNIQREIARVIIGQSKLIELSIVAILADGHVLIEGVPGVAKTLTAKLLARCISAGFSRLQFTPDLMPSDVIGTTVFNQHSAQFEFNQGPIFSNIILIDEINRAPAKTQSALFEVMEERQITVDGNTRVMEKPFIVFATQNPIEQEGTYRLPEAQLDRFLFKIEVDYPSLDEEIQILTLNHQAKTTELLQQTKAQISASQIIEFQAIVRKIHIDENLRKYIASIVDKTRKNSAIYLSASPRASINIMLGAKALAAIRGRDFVTPEDIREITYPVLRHRIMLTPEKEMEGISVDTVLKQVIDSVEIPR